MSNDRPNVLLLTIDALRADRSSILGYDRPTTPALDRLAKSGLLCTQTVCNAVFSQPSLTSMFTSSMPLSFGGYDSGAEGRPDSIFRHFKNSGYQVHQISTYPTISRYFGFSDDGIESSVLFSLNALPGLALAMMRESIRAFEAGNLSQDKMQEKVRPVVESLFSNVDDYCRVRLQQKTADVRDFPTSRMVNDGYDFKRILRLIAKHRRSYDADNGAYIFKHLIPYPGNYGWLARQWKFMRSPAAYLSESAFRAGNAVLSRINPRLAQLRDYRFKRYLDADGLTNRVISTIDAARKKPEPFFIWTHYFDTHVPYCPGPGRQWYNSADDYLVRLGYDRGMDLSVGINGKPTTDEAWETWSALYDAAVSYVDEKVDRLLDHLERTDLMDSTLIVISGDHGEELGEHGNIGHHFLPYEHSSHVPMLFHGPGVEPGTVDGLTNLLDMAPTIAKFAGLEPAAGWQGIAVTSPDVELRDHQIIECFHGGNCLFETRPLYIGVRTRTHNFFWKEYRDPTDKFSLDGHELYELAKDPNEAMNIYAPDHPLVPGFNAIVARRMAELPEISDERLVAAFGASLAANVRLQVQKSA